MSVTIQELSKQDELEWRRLWALYLKFYETELPEEVFRTTWARLLNDGKDGLYGLMARDDAGNAVGIVHYLYHPSCWTIEKVCYLQDLYVDDTARGKGAGRALIEAVYSAADQADQGRVYWTTHDHNTQARHLYDQVASVTRFIKYNRY